MGIRVLLAACLLTALLAGCGKSEQSAVSEAKPVPIEAGDECHVCGMLIGKFPGPKGEVYVRGSDKVLKYCSTRDLFSELLQPEMKATAQKIYVHDMGATDWEHPSDAAFTDARSAWYVAGHDLRGAMGPTLASFAKREDAQRFIAEHGGRLLHFDDISLEMLASLSAGAHGKDSARAGPR